MKKIIFSFIAILMLIIISVNTNLIKNFIRDFFSTFTFASSASKSSAEDINLSSYSNIVSIISHLEQENSELRELLNINKKQKYKIIPAEIIIRDPRSWNQRFVINKGESHGLKTGLPVLTINTKTKQFKTKFSIAGKISSLSSKTAEVITIFDRDFQLPVIFNEGKNHAILSGAIPPKLTFFNPDNLKTGESDVLSSPFSNICPPYISVGSILIDKPPQIFYYQEELELTPWADISNARFAIIIIPEEN